MSEPRRIEGATFVCEVPSQLGAVTGFKQSGERVYAETESGIQMLIPTVPPRPTQGKE